MISTVSRNMQCLIASGLTIYFATRRFGSSAGNFQSGDPGAILKKYDPVEHRSFQKLMQDVLRPYVPEYRGEATKGTDRYMQLQDLLCEFDAACVMDVKMGRRTYLEDELVKAREKPTLRKDMYQKMVEVDPAAPTEKEHLQQGITKPRYMQWRDDMSSSVEHGFRIEGIRTSDGASIKNFKKTKHKENIKESLQYFVGGSTTLLNKYLRRLKSIRATQEDSPFFRSHEVIGSSLLFVHDKTGQASVWMIDFGKTVPLAEGITVDHRSEWREGSHEDGYLYGLDSLVQIFTELLDSSTSGDNTTSAANLNSSVNTDRSVNTDGSAITDNCGGGTGNSVVNTNSDRTLKCDTNSESNNRTSDTTGNPS